MISAITLALIIVLVKNFSINLSLITRDLDLIVLSACLSTIVFFLKGLRFHFILKRTGFPTNILDSIVLRFGSEFFAFIGVSYIGDELYRVYVLEKSNVNRGIAISISYLEVFLEVITAFTIILLGFIFSIIYGVNNIYLTLAMILSLIIVVFNLLFILGFSQIYSFLSKLLYKIGFKSFSKRLISDDIREFKRHFSNLMLDSKFSMLMLSISILIGLFSGSVLHILTVRYSTESNFIISVLAVYIANTLSSLPITVGGLGVTEGVIIAVFYPSTTDISAYIAILYRITSYVIPFIISSILLNLGVLRRFGGELGEEIDANVST